jgi:hypothetical protein
MVAAPHANHGSLGPIPGEYDRSTLTHREPGAISGRPNGGDIPPAPPEWLDARTRHEHEFEGGSVRHEYVSLLDSIGRFRRVHRNRGPDAGHRHAA